MSAPLSLGHASANAVTSVTMSPSSAVASGITCVALITSAIAVMTGGAITDSQGNVWAFVATATMGNAHVAAYTSTLTNPLGLSDTVRYGQTSSSGLSIALVSCVGYTVLDTPVTKTAQGTSTAYSVTGGTATQVGDLNIGFLLTYQHPSNPASGFTTLQSFTTPDNGTSYSAYAINPATAGLTFGGTNTNAQWACLILGLLQDPSPITMYINQGFGMSFPLPWRKVTPLHRKLGARSTRFFFGATAPVPLIAAPQTINLRYDAINAIDRIVGFTLSVGGGGAAADFVLQELNTNWFIDYTLPGTRGVYLSANIETLPDEVNLQFYFSANIGAPVYVAFNNLEIVPHNLSS